MNNATIFFFFVILWQVSNMRQKYEYEISAARNHPTSARILHCSLWFQLTISKE